MDTYASFKTHIREDFAESGSIINAARAILSRIPVVNRGLHVLPQIFAGNMSSMELIDRIIFKKGNLEIIDVNVVSEEPYYRFFVKNQLTTPLKISDVKIQASIVHCEFDNIDLSGKYTAQLNLVKDKKYNSEYKTLIYDAIPVGSRSTLEKINGLNAREPVQINLKDLRVGDKNIAPKVCIFTDSDFKQINLINDENIPIIFINCSGNINIIFNNQLIVDTIKPKLCPACPKQECPACPKQECPKQECPKQECPKQQCPTCATCPNQTCAACATCPPPENPTTKLIGTAVAAVVVTVIVYSAILHFRK